MGSEPIDLTKCFSLPSEAGGVECPEIPTKRYPDPFVPGPQSWFPAITEDGATASALSKNDEVFRVRITVLHSPRFSNQHLVLLCLVG